MKFRALMPGAWTFKGVILTNFWMQSNNNCAEFDTISLIQKNGWDCASLFILWLQTPFVELLEADWRMIES